nr:MAG TPA: hypothetical protein [Caudoviricetes sp.]
MTIKTLEHIHYLLKESVETERRKYEMELKTEIEMEEDESTTKSALKMQKEFVEKLMRGWTIAQDALEDFEAHEWV